jgi:SAM-dependent methyltransferase
MEGNWLVCAQAHRYPVVDDIPVMLLNDVQQTHWVATHSLEHLESAEPVANAVTGGGAGDPFVQEAVGATCGNLYKSVIGGLPRYPIPDFPFEAPAGTPLLDIGCHWGRWCVAAARRGYRVIGVDPFLRAIRAARRVASALDVEATFVVADGRYLPFAAGTFGMVHSYSVLQHFSPEDVGLTAHEIGRVLAKDGSCHVQMAHAIGLLNLIQQARRGFRTAKNFEVRYWQFDQLRSLFEAAVGPTALTADGFFTIGAQSADLDLLPLLPRAVVRTSDALRRLSRRVPGLARVADSLYVNATRTASAPAPPG